MPRRGKPFTDPGAGKAQSMRSSGGASLAEQTSTNGRAVFSGSKGPTIAWCPAMFERWVFAATLSTLSTLPAPCQ
jgi:hypothetical protein